VKIINNILFVTYHNPSSTGGGSFASRAFINAFSKIIKGKLILLCASSVNEKIFKKNTNMQIIKVERRSIIQKIIGICKLELHRMRKAFMNYVNKNNKTIDLIVFDGSIVAGDLIDFAKENSIPTICIHHNVDGKYFKDSQSFYTLWGISSFLIDFRQKNAFQKSTLNFTLTENDKNELEHRYQKKIGKTNHNIGCFEFREDFKISKEISQKKRSEKFNLIITGSLITRQTENGVIWFIEVLLKKLKNFTNISVTIAGRSPSKKIVLLCNSDKRIVLIANPISMDDLIQKADIYICPARLGSGIKLRVMDGLRNGVPVIVNEVSSLGYENHFGEPWFKIFKDENDFLPAFLELYQNIKNERIDRNRIIKRYNNDFSFEAGIKKIKRIIDNSGIGEINSIK
jgi:glycosyltransferase involved in cell wall biosynthesis